MVYYGSTDEPYAAGRAYLGCFASSDSLTATVRRRSASLLNDLVPVSFGSWLKQQRQAAGVTRDDLAERTACSSTTLEKI